MLKITNKGDKAYVTFSIMPNVGENIVLCGDWSDWKEEKMKVKKSGELYLTKVLKCGSSYQYGYKINESIRRPDDEVECVDSPFGSKNSLLVL